jgi:hypothetical protein
MARAGTLFGAASTTDLAKDLSSLAEVDQEAIERGEVVRLLGSCEITR